jgi:hypothetical protein
MIIIFDIDYRGGVKTKIHATINPSLPKTKPNPL